MKKLISLILALSFVCPAFASFTAKDPEYHFVKTIIRETSLFKEKGQLHPYQTLNQLSEEALDWSDVEWNNYLNGFLTPESKMFLEKTAEVTKKDRNLGKAFRNFIKKNYIKVRTLGREHGMAIVVAAIIIEIVDWTLPPLLIAIGLPQIGTLLFALPEFEIFMGSVLLVKSLFTYIHLVRLYGGIRIRHHYAQLHRDVLKELQVKKDKGMIVKFPHLDSGFVLMPKNILRLIRDLAQKKIDYITLKSLKTFLEVNVLSTSSINDILNDKELTDEEKIIHITFEISQTKTNWDLLKKHFPDQFISELPEVDEENHLTSWSEKAVLDLQNLNNITSSFEGIKVGDTNTIYYFQIYEKFILPEYTEKTSGTHIKTFHSLHKKFLPFLVEVDKNPEKVWDFQTTLKLNEYFERSFSFLK